MAKSKNYTTADLERLGLIEITPGIYYRHIVKLGGGQEVAVDNLIVKEKVNDSKDFTAAPVVEWFIPYQVPSKKNCRQNFVTKSGKQMSIPSKRYKDYVTATKKYWETFGIEFNQTIRKLDLKWPVDIHLTFIRSTKQRFDYCNVCQSVEDIMVDFGWLPDDSAQYLKPSFGDYKIDKQQPGVIIKVIIK